MQLKFPILWEKNLGRTHNGEFCFRIDKQIIKLKLLLVVPDSHPFDSTPDPTVAKLLEADAQLATQEADLSAQLQSIQEKRKSLKTVIDLFAPADSDKPLVASAPTSTVATNDKLEQDTEDQATPELNDLETTPAVDAAMPAADNQNQQAQKTPDAASRRQAARQGRSKKATKKVEGWQQYLRQEFSHAALPETVATLLQQQPQQALDIPTIVDALFVEQMPQQVRHKARDRISNVLSEGARKNKWYRTGAGSYSMSPETTKA